MVKVLIDTNVAIDLIDARIPFVTEAREVFISCGRRKIRGIITANSITDIYYIMRKKIGHEDTITALESLFSRIVIASVTKRDMQKAMASPMTDLEDALIAACAKRIKADYIITRNTAHFKNSPVPAITPKNFLKLQKQSAAGPA